MRIAIPGLLVALALLAALAWPWRGPAGGAPGSPRKCLVDAKVVYTDGECPAGSRPQALAGGALTVLPAPAAPPASAPAAGVRGLALRPGEPTLRETHMQQQLR